MKRLCGAISAWLAMNGKQETDPDPKPWSGVEDTPVAPTKFTVTHGDEICGEQQDCEGSGIAIRRREVLYIVLHRIDMSEVTGYDNTISSLVDFFESHPDGIKATAGQFPYHYVISENGDVDQMEDLDVATPHAAKYNRTSVGVSLVGDFRSSAATPEQLRSTLEVCVELLGRYPSAQIIAHDQLKGGSKDPRKRCPGRFIDCVQMQKAARAFYAVLKLTDS